MDDNVNKIENLLYINEVRSDSVNEIITSVPTWIIRWGITLVFVILALIVVGSAFISYPDTVKSTLKVNSLNSPKVVVAHQNGKLAALLVADGEVVKKDQLLGYLETTAEPKDVLELTSILKKMRKEIFMQDNYERDVTIAPNNLNLGELQSAYQVFYQEFLQFQATLNKGYYTNRKDFLKKELNNIFLLKNQIIKQGEIQQQEFKNVESEYKAYKKLYQNKVISRSEFVQQENRYLSSKYPLQQTETQLLNNVGNYNAKEKELIDLEHTIIEQQAKFIQVLNMYLSEAERWALQYMLKSPSNGKLSFAGIIQENQQVFNNQEIFVINTGNTDFFGELQIPQYNMGKVKVGQKTLVKLRSYPFEQYGLIRGTLSYISDAAYHDSIFIARVKFEHIENKDVQKKIVLKNGMQANAEIVTDESSLLQRFLQNLTKLIGGN